MAPSGDVKPIEKIIVQVDSDLEDLIPGYLENRNKDIESITEALRQNDFETISAKLFFAQDGRWKVYLKDEH